jgi:hypothetical protein
MNSTALIFTKAAAARILGVKPAAIVSYRVWAFTVWVHVKGCRPTLVSKKAFYADFVEFRKAGGQALKNQARCSGHKTYTVPSSLGGAYTVDLGAMACECEDYKKQLENLGGGACKHSYAVLALLGFGTLAEYQATRRSKRLQSLMLA